MKALQIFTNIRLYLFLSGLSLSSTAAYYSMIGLTAIFSGAFVPILIMGGSLEFAKIVTATWLYKSRETIPMFMKIYMTIAVVVLMFITSMGIFGFLSKAHLENGVNKTADVSSLVVELQSDIKADEKIVADDDKQLNLLDNTVKEDYNIVVRQKKIRSQLMTEKKEASVRLRENNRKLAEANLQVQKVEVEVGPLKYIAELIYGDKARDYLDNTVRIVILMLVFVFDPLAVMLLIAASRKPPTVVGVQMRDGVLFNKNDILDMEK
jgi:hypothetical protein